MLRADGGWRKRMKRVAVIGVGIMGSAIARNLVKAAFRVTGYDPDGGRLDLLRESGGTPCASAAEAAREADIVLTSLPSAKALAATATALIGLNRRGLVVA